MRAARDARRSSDSGEAIASDRGRLPSPTITRQEVRAILEQHEVEPTLVDEIDRILRGCERSRFAGERFDGHGLVEQAKGCLARLDRIRWNQTAGPAAGASR